MHVASANVASFSYDVQKVLDLSRPFEEVIESVVSLMVETCGNGNTRRLLRLAVAESDRFPQLGQLTYDRTIELMTPLGEYLKAASADSLTRKEALHAAYHLMSMAVGGFGYLLVKPSVFFGKSSYWVKSVTRLFAANFRIA